MKKAKPLIAVLLLCAALLCACSGADPSVPVENIIPSYDKTEEVTAVSGDGSFSVKSKKYTYDGTDLVILAVKNQSDKTLSVTVNASYIDDEGDAVGGDSRVFETFPKGYETCFIFWPSYQFESFSYSIECEETDKDCLVTEYSAEITRLLAGSVIDYEKYHTDETRQGVYISVREKNTSPEPLDIGDRYLIIFGEDDTILSIGRLPAMSYYTPDTTDAEDWRFVICRATGNGLDALKKPIRAVVIPEHVREIPPPPPPEDESEQTNETQSVEEIS